MHCALIDTVFNYCFYTAGSLMLIILVQQLYNIMLITHTATFANIVTRDSLNIIWIFAKMQSYLIDNKSMKCLAMYFTFENHDFRVFQGN